MLYVPEPEDAAPASWAWGDGKDKTRDEERAISHEEREATRHAAGAGVEDACVQGQLHAAHSRALKAGAREERRELSAADKKKKKESWNAKVRPRKRDDWVPDGSAAARGRTRVPSAEWRLRICAPQKRGHDEADGTSRSPRPLKFLA